MSVLGAFEAGREIRGDVLQFVLRYFPEQPDFVASNIDAFTQTRIRLGIGGALGLLWASQGVFGAISTAVNHAWAVERPRSFWGHRWFSLLMMSTAVMLLFIALLVLSASKASGTPWSAVLFSQMPVLQAVSDWGDKLTTFLLFVLIVGLIFYFVPNTPVRLRDVWPGAVLTAVLWRGAYEGFSWYLRSWARASVHGSIATVVWFLIWIYISAVHPALRRRVHGRHRADPARAPRTRRAAERVVEQMPNRLASEKSPYLLQHAANPVDWYPWGEEAFAAARREDRPIFLSVGYATCHWCHVMEHESFEDPAIAGILNARFVSIKVDREERPDVDRVYMLFVQATTGSGGWPMSVWLTPELQPFYGGTYFPPDGRYGRPGFAAVLEEISRAWQENRADVIESAAGLTSRIRGFATARPQRRLRCARPRGARRRGGGVRSRLRPPAWRIRRRAEIPAARGTALPAARVQADRP